MTVLVLWENHAEGQAKRFGPHSFLVACVAAELGLPIFDRFALQDRIAFRTCNGNNKLIGRLADDRLWDAGRHVVAVLDRDKIRKAIQQPATASDDAVVAAIAALAVAGCRDRLEILLLADNVETLLGHVGAPEAQVQTARAKATRNQAKLARDAILERAAADPVAFKHARAAMPSFDALVVAVSRRLREG